MENRPPLVIIFVFLFFVAANVSAWTPGDPPEIEITSPTSSSVGYVEGSTIPFEISGQETADAMGCYLDADSGTFKPFISNTNMESFFGPSAVTVGPHHIDCWAINDWGEGIADTPYLVTAAPTTSTTLPPTAEEIPEFPTAALPALVALGGYIAIRRLKK